MEDELSSSSHTNAVHYDIVKDAWGYRSQLIEERAQDLLGVQYTKLTGISIGNGLRSPTSPYILTNILSGANHKVYRVAMDDGRTVIARVLSPSLTEYGAGVYPEDTMEAEIAAMRYVKTHSSIPVPEVYYHDKDKNGEVGGEWMLLEDLRGTNLSLTWREMSIDQHQKVGLVVVDVWEQLMRLRFGAIGSINSPADDDKTFYVGPMTFMPTTIAKMMAPPAQSKCGLFSCARDWLLALAHLDMRFLNEAPLKEEEKSLMIPVISDIKAAPLPYLDNNEASDPSPWSANVLFHVDLGAHNIMVDSDDPTIITGVIDWEGACVIPLWSILPRFSDRLRAPYITKPDELGALEELRGRMKRTLLEAVPEWAKLCAECREARMLRTRAATSIAKPSNVYLFDEIF
ncbi:kinase-like domain-containing protein [Gautieria morchelliformis]|nr:kinase-like domain-containing protein [Gautieria morchelliformis]